MAKAQARQAMREDQIATVKTFIIKNAGGQVDQKDLSSLSRLTDATLHALVQAAKVYI